MNLTCPSCRQKSIAFLTAFLHVGSGSNRVNRFRCPTCDAPLKCYFSLPLYVLCGIILQLLVSGGSPLGMLIGGVLFAGLVFLFYPIRQDEDFAANAPSALAGGASFETPAEQGWYKLESTLFAGLAFAVWAMLWFYVANWLGWGQLGLILYFPILFLSIIGAGLYTVAVRRIGANWIARLLVDAGVVLLFLKLVVRL